MAKQKHLKKSNKIIKTAKERIQTLYKQAACANNQALSDRYIYLARKISMKCKVKLTSTQKRKICNHCYIFFTAKNSIVRIHQHRIIYYCRKCKKYSRISIK